MLIKNFRTIPKIEKIYANAVCLCYMPINSNLGFSFFLLFAFSYNNFTEIKFK